MIVAGIGCRRETAASDILAALDAALSHHALSRTVLTALATGPAKAGEPGLAEAASRLSLPLEIAGETALAEAAPRLVTRSARSLAATGSESLSEAAALAVAGPESRLLGSRFTRKGVAVAFAALPGDHP